MECRHFPYAQYASSERANATFSPTYCALRVRETGSYDFCCCFSAGYTAELGTGYERTRATVESYPSFNSGEYVMEFYAGEDAVLENIAGAIAGCAYTSERTASWTVTSTTFDVLRKTYSFKIPQHSH